MELFEIIGYLIGLLVGVTMGLIGGGGFVLLPALIYLLGCESTLATAYTLVLIGVTALIGVLPRIRQREVDFRIALTLGIPILIGTLLVRGWLTHLIPDFEIDSAGNQTNIPLVLFQFGGLQVTKKMLVLVVFATVLLVSFASMMGWIGKDLKPRPNFRSESPTTYYVILTTAGFFIGVLSAFIGAGGGVMVVPLLVVVIGSPMRTVIGTSLAIMAGKLILGFSGDVFRIGDRIEWGVLGVFAAVMIIGVLIGTSISGRISVKKLRRGFAWLVLAMAIFIFVKELVFS